MIRAARRIKIAAAISANHSPLFENCELQQLISRATSSPKNGCEERTGSPSYGQLIAQRSLLLFQFYWIRC